MKVDASIFKAYDVRGVVDQTLTPLFSRHTMSAALSTKRSRRMLYVPLVEFSVPWRLTTVLSVSVSAVTAD